MVVLAPRRLVRPGRPAECAQQLFGAVPSSAGSAHTYQSDRGPTRQRILEPRMLVGGVAQDSSSNTLIPRAWQAASSASKSASVP